jgi:hypothetical protein
MPRVAFILMVVATVASCDRLWPDVTWRSDRYITAEVDSRGQMNLGFDTQDGSWQTLVGPTVFGVGADEKHIVVKQHPSTDGFGHYDRSVTNYFVVERTRSSDFRERQRLVKGPMTEEEFKRLAAATSLPPFQKVFGDLQ